MQMMRMFSGFVVGTACTAMVFCLNLDASKRITGIYTNMEFHPESGDVVGAEIFLVRSGMGDFVTFQISEGAPFPPVVVPARINEQRISFELPEGNRPLSGVFEGEIGNDAIRGNFAGTGFDLFVLKKKKSYWQ
jgi:hypothetical protein